MRFQLDLRKLIFHTATIFPTNFSTELFEIWNIVRIVREITESDKLSRLHLDIASRCVFNFAIFSPLNDSQYLISCKQRADKIRRDLSKILVPLQDGYISDVPMPLFDGNSTVPTPILIPRATAIFPKLFDGIFCNLECCQNRARDNRELPIAMFCITSPPLNYISQIAAK